MISIIICTHNRADVLGYCLSSFVNQTASQELYEVIVIDNNSADNTKDIVLSFSERLKNLRYIFEGYVGLSAARNTGFREAKYEWVSYVDDDAKAYPNYVERAIWIAGTYSFDCFGGRFFPWYLEDKPKWLSEDFGEFPLLLDKVGKLPPNRHVAGGVIVFRRSVLEEVHGFPLKLGMSGDRVGYGEENWVQDELRKCGYVIGFDPELKIDHLVAMYKHRLGWHLKRQYAKGKAARILRTRKSRSFIFMLFWASLVTLKQLLVNSFRLLKRNYYYQNYALDSFGYLIQTIGYISK